jgi:hypothetical protein
MKKKNIIKKHKKINSHEAWLYEPANKEVLEMLQKSLKKEGTKTFRDWAAENKIILTKD